MKKKMLIALLAASVFVSSAAGDMAVLATEAYETETQESESAENTEETETTEETEELESTEEAESTEEMESTEEDVILDEVVSDNKLDITKNRPTGFMRMQEMTMENLDESQVYHPAEESDVESTLYYSSKYQSTWDCYSTNYFYNQLSSEEREIWDNLDELCLSYLTGTDDALSTGKSDDSFAYATEFVYMEGLTSAEASNLVQMFKISNPQYYFLNTVIWSSSSAYGVYKSIGVYSSFADGEKRKKATEKVKKQAESWVNEAANYSTEEEKAKVLHDLVVNKVDYNYDIIGSDGSIDMKSEDSAYTQNAYSVFCKDLTVCAGYSQAYEMVCNASGVDCIAVTSLGHEWNKVRINDSWYNVDCTWADTGSGNPISYYFYERNDAAYDNLDSNHVEELFWEDYLPVCAQDSNPSDFYTVGTLPSVTETTAAPSITISDGKAKLTSGTSGAVIYYTTDGSTPSPASTRCLKYTGKFKVGAGKTVKAVAVSDGRWDSSVTSKKNASVTYKIVFKGNGSTGGKMSTQKMTYGSGKKLTANAFKKTGYTFAGWNTKADGSGKSYKNKADGSKLTKTAGKTVKLYAQWKVNKYTIKYNGNGSTSGKMSAKKNCKYGKKYTLAANAYKKKGYKFVGWNTKKDGSGKSYKNKAQIKNLTAKSGKTVTLYAQWKKK